MSKEFLEVGKIVNTHALAGEVKVQPWCDSAEVLLDFDTLYWDDGTPVRIKKSSVHKGCAIMRLEGVDTIDAAQALRNKMLYLRRDDIQLPEDTVFIQDILGFSIFDDRTLTLIGILRDVLNTTSAQDLYEIERANGKLVYIPAVKPFLKSIQMDERVIHICSIEGLIDED